MIEVFGKEQLIKLHEDLKYKLETKGTLNGLEYEMLKDLKELFEEDIDNL